MIVAGSLLGFYQQVVRREADKAQQGRRSHRTIEELLLQEKRTWLLARGNDDRELENLEYREFHDLRRQLLLGEFYDRAPPSSMRTTAHC